ncbi:MAG TPA: type IV pilus twitching motility protein PilT [Clostridiaceae bacterium]|nr:type IV pilus twitching motility protein PilT [Clostridiaceae bacterium]
MSENKYEYDYPVTLCDLLTIAATRGASDLHLVCGYPPSLRIDGKITVLEYPYIKPYQMEAMLFSILENWQKETLETKWELDFSFSINGVARFRGNIMRQRGTYAAAFRVVPYTIPPFETLGLPSEIKNLCNLTRGLVLVTGATGSGKSTTLASLIDIINKTRCLSIITIEDPIEFLHRHNKSTVKQREIGADTHSFQDALKHVLRHDPDVILIGEMRDKESISIALTAAETGHLVFSTLHTQTAPQTISRIVDAFSDDNKDHIRQQLAGSLKAVISQQLIPMNSGNGRVVAVEYMISTPAIRNLIREGKDHQLYSAIQTGHNYGMCTMDQSLVKLYKQGKISYESVYEYCIDRAEVDRLINRSYIG